LAKNILVDSKFTCKISSWQHAIIVNNVQEDSGLYTAVQVRVIVTPVQVRIEAQHYCSCLQATNYHFVQSQDDGYVTPRRWAAPEVVYNRLYSVHSDIWALGVVAWETVSRGCLPYAALTDDEVTASVVNGYRLPRPKDCPLSLYDLVMRCWAEKCEARVACHDLVQALLALLPSLSTSTSITSPAALWLRYGVTFALLMT
jgi:serine/threonine protein kinase